MINGNCFGEFQLLGDVAQFCALMGVQDFQYGNLLFVAAVISFTSLVLYAGRLTFLKVQNFFLERSIELLKVKHAVLEFRVALIKAGLIGNPVQEAASDDAGDYRRGEGQEPTKVTMELYRHKKHGWITGRAGNDIWPIGPPRSP